MDLHFRLANTGNIELLVELMRQLYIIDNDPFEEHAARSALEKLIREPSLGRLWVINSGDEAIGYIVLTFGYSLEFHGRDAFIDELFITAGNRNQGVGTKTMQFVVDACHDLDIHALHLEVERHNIAGQALYRKFGFKDHDRYLMTRWIAR